MFTGGIVRSSKLSANEYLIFDEKKKLSCIKYSLLFSNNKAPLKKSSLDAKNGLKTKPLDEENFLDAFLSYNILELFIKSSSKSVFA